MRTVAVIALVAAFAIGGCGGSGGHGSREPGPSESARPSSPAAAVTVDWGRRSVSHGAATPDGWHIAFCPGRAPLLCIRGDSGDRGVVELLSFPTSRIDAFRGGSTADALASVARDNLRTITADRRSGCGPDYRVRRGGPAPAVVAGRPGVRWSLTGSRSGAVVEREISFATVVGGQLYLLHAAGLEPEGCLRPESEFRVAAFASFLPTLESLVRTSRLPGRDR